MKEDSSVLYVKRESVLEDTLRRILQPIFRSDKKFR